MAGAHLPYHLEKLFHYPALALFFLYLLLDQIGTSTEKNFRYNGDLVCNSNQSNKDTSYGIHIGIHLVLMIEYGVGSLVLNSLGTIVLWIAIRITSPTVNEMLQEMENEENQQQDLQNSDHDDNQDAEPGSSQQSNGKEDEGSPILIILVGICTSIYFLDTMGRHNLPKGQIHAGCIYSDVWEWFYVILVMFNDVLELIESLLCHFFIVSVAIKCFKHFYRKRNTTGYVVLESEKDSVVKLADWIQSVQKLQEKAPAQFNKQTFNTFRRSLKEKAKDFEKLMKAVEKYRVKS